MRSFGERFDHNLHALRIVESFENSVCPFSGTESDVSKCARESSSTPAISSPGEIPELDEYLPGCGRRSKPS